MEGLKLILIVDYKMGNLPNVKRAVELFTKDVVISSDIEEIKKADKIILPGVGAFGDAIRNIESMGLRDAIIEAAKTSHCFLERLRIFWLYFTFLIFLTK